LIFLVHKPRKDGEQNGFSFSSALGAIKSTFLPSRTGGNAKVCGKVGSEKPSSANALRTGLAGNSKTELELSFCIFFDNLLDKRML